MLTFLKKIRDLYIKTIQKVLVTVALTLIYFIGMGITWLYAIIFKRSLIFAAPKETKSYWEDASDYNVTLDNCQDLN